MNLDFDALFNCAGFDNVCEEGKQEDIATDENEEDWIVCGPDDFCIQVIIES